MKRLANDLTSLAFHAPVVAMTRTARTASGTITPAEFTRMWVEKPVAFWMGLAAMQAELAIATFGAAGRAFPRQADWTKLAGIGLRPVARTVNANHRRLAPRR